MKYSLKKLISLLIIPAFIMSSGMAFAINDVVTSQTTDSKKVTKVKKQKKSKKAQKETAKAKYTNDVHSVFTLKDCIEIAIENNPYIRSSILNEDVYKSKIGQAWSNYFPEISASIEASRTGNKYTGNTSLYGRHYETMGYIPSLSAEMLLFDFGKTKAMADMSKRTYESKKADTKENINTIIYDIKSTYYNILFAQAQVRVYEETVKDYELQLKQAWGFYNLGKKAKIDVVTAEYNLGKAQLNLVKAQDVLEVAYVLLAQIMGIPEYTNYELSDQLHVNDYDKKSEDIMKVAMEVRPELISAKKASDAAKMNLRAIRRNYTPNLGIFAGYGNGIGNEYNVSSAQVGLGVSYNALNIMKVKKQIDEASALYKKSQADYESVKNTVYLNVQENYIKLNTAKKAIVIADLALKQAKEQYRQVTGRYKAGIGDAIELKDGENTYLNARLDFYNAVLNYNVVAAALEKEIGVPIEFSEKTIIDIDELKNK